MAVGKTTLSTQIDRELRDSFAEYCKGIQQKQNLVLEAFFKGLLGGELMLVLDPKAGLRVVCANREK